MQSWGSGRFRLTLAVALSCCTCLVFSVCAYGLSGGRVYELVSPLYKGGYSTSKLVAVGPTGERAVFGSLGAFDGDLSNSPLSNEYVARRGASGWTSTPLNAPAELLPYGGTLDFSASLESLLSEGQPGPNEAWATAESIELNFFFHNTGLPDVAANFEVAGMRLKALNGGPVTPDYEGGSPDFSHIVFRENRENAFLLREAVGSDSNLYDLATGDTGGTPTLRLVGLNNKGKVLVSGCPVVLGAAGGRDSSYNSVADDGEELFFTAGVKEPECRDQLFVRIGGVKTLEVSKLASEQGEHGCVEVPCTGAEKRAPAEFQGANEAGSRVFFTTGEPLVGGDADISTNLYMANIGCPAGGECEPAKKVVTSLVEVSKAVVAGEAAEVKGVVAVAPDGSHVYFVARGMLSNDANAEGELPLKGADNLYAYNSASEGSPVFIGDLCSGPEKSGVVEDTHCPPGLTGNEGERDNDTDLWLIDEPEAQTNGNGDFFVFSSYGRLLRNDTDAAKDVYRYDVETGSLVRVSVGEAGYDANGNNDACGEESCDASISDNQEHGEVYKQRDLNSRAMSEDGSTIIFKTADELSQTAVNGLSNVYEWREVPGSSQGSVSLVSSGSASEGVEEAVMSETGDDIFFKTSQGLLPQDTDGQSDIYDARVGGGFPSSAAPVQPCSGDACQGPLTNPAPLLVPGSVSQAPEGNLPPLVKKTIVAKAEKAKAKPKKKVKSKKKKGHGNKAKASNGSVRAAGSRGGSK